MTPRSLLTGVGSALLVAGLAGYLTQKTRVPDSPSPAATDWSWIGAELAVMEAGPQALPALADQTLWTRGPDARTREREAELARQEAEQAAAAAAAESAARAAEIAGPGWRFAGVTGEPDGTLALMEVDGRLQRIAPGGTVTGSVSVTAVSATELVLQIDGEEVVFQLFRAPLEGS
ncbi:MAG: hypothetical protein AAGE01_01360 [Pseudomonadota bacterium]